MHAREVRTSVDSAKRAVSHSRWNTRGWTLQEARLARRCLFFTQYQMYLVCRTNTRSESIHTDPICNGLSSFMNDFTLDSSLFSDIRSIDNRGHDMFLDTQMFSHRVLSCGSDALDAMRGILARSPFFTFWGIPIKPNSSPIDSSVGIAFGLLCARDFSPNHFGYGLGHDTRPNHQDAEATFQLGVGLALQAALPTHLQFNHRLLECSRTTHRAWKTSISALRFS